MRRAFLMDDNKKKVTEFMCYRNDKMTELEIKEATPAYKESYTYADYITWDDDIRWELIDGIPYLMGAPNREHQELLGNLYLLFGTFLKGKHCKVFFAPFDVRLNFDTLDNTVVQPDLMIVCDHNKLDKAGIKGVPEMLVEILSPSTSKHDKTLKYETYRKNGVQEYWILDPKTKTLTVNLLNNGVYISHPYTIKDTVPVHTLKGFTINLSEVFEDL